MKQFGRAALLAALVVHTSGCDEPAGPGPEQPAGPRLETTASSPAVQRIALDINATGSFRPGTPIVVTSRARGIRPAGNVDYALVVLDEDSTENATVRERGRDVARSRENLPRGAERPLTATVTFPHAGYYRIVAIARSEPVTGETKPVGDSAVLNLSSETLYVLVDEQGGRLMRSYDPSVTSNAAGAPRYGAYGRFMPRRPGSPVAAGRVVSQITAQQVSPVTIRRAFIYYDDSARVNRPVADAEVSITCVQPSYPYDPINSFTIRSDANGNVVFNCAYNAYNGRAELRNRYSTVFGRDGQLTGVPFYEYDASSTFTPPNRHAAHVFQTLNRYVPVAEQRFGHSRGVITAYIAAEANADGTEYFTHYQTGEDRIYMSHRRVFGPEGTFTTVHEYGHAFHARAIEQAASYACGPNNVHLWDVQYTLSCAWVEGFATFFGAWVAGDALTNDFYSDNTIETQVWARDPTDQPSWQSGDGARIEGAVAAFFYDLVDGPASPDGPNNETGVDDDAAVYPASFIAKTMALCVITPSTSTNPAFDGIDQLIYCLEGNGTAYNEARAIRPDTPWRSVTAVYPNVAPPAGFSPATVRALWKRNLYGR